ncbi:MAG TPA: glycerate kinase [Candidatus Limnocylindrales bacterium]|nr:glycerate kinase [Candidatus Limnocylindrales bacterium]
MLKVVVAPNAFKGTLTAPQAAAAIARGVREVFPDAEVVEIPVADGGDGTVEALVSAQRGEYRTAGVEGPLGEPIGARYGLIDAHRTAVVELATASGLTLIPKARRDPRRTSTYGFGQLLAAARREGVATIIAGIGGSATNDGGAGMAQALGYRLLDEKGRDLERGGAALARLARIDASGFDAGWTTVQVRVACDVDNPLTGRRGASAVYGPQKGADPETVRELDAALHRFAEVVERDLGRKVAELPGGGAAGGTGAGLVAFLDAMLEPGAPLVVAAAGLEAALIGADLVITGEGRADEQTAYGKAPGEVARRAAAKGVPVLLLAGSKGPGWEALHTLGVTSIVTLTEEGGDAQQTIRDPGGSLERATVVACRSRRWER